MRMLVILLILVVIAGVGLGFYRGWFSLSSSGDTDKPNVTLSVDKERIEADKDKAVETVTPEAD